MRSHFSAKHERERKLKSVLSFASSLPDRLKNPHDILLQQDLQSHILSLPLQPSTQVNAKQDELDKLGIELWNLSTSLRRSDPWPSQKGQDAASQKARTLCVLRIFAFWLLDVAGWQAVSKCDRRQCVRLLKVALKTSRICIELKELSDAEKVLQRASDYQEVLEQEAGEASTEEIGKSDCLRLEYYMLRTALAWRQNRMDMAEQTFSHCKKMTPMLTPDTAETLADLLYEIGKDFLGKSRYESAVRWLERAYDIVGEEELERLGPEAAQAYMKLSTDQGQKKAWDMVKLLDTDYGEKMAVHLLKLEFLFAVSTVSAVDHEQVHQVMLRLIRSVVLNQTNFKTIIHYIHRLKECSGSSAGRILNDLLELRLYREENATWLEEAVITRLWVGTTSQDFEDTPESILELLDKVSQNTKYPLSPPATHAAQTLLWKRVEVAYNHGAMEKAEKWCHACLHRLFQKAGELNKSKIARKIILCALSRQDHTAAYETYTKMSDTGKDEPVTRFIMYKAALQSNDMDAATECLDAVCRKSAKDATLLYACVIEAQNHGDKNQAVTALQKVLDRYDHSAPAGVHLPALLRCTARIMMSILERDGKFSSSTADELCKLFEGAYIQCKASLRRPTTPALKLFTTADFEWFAKNTYNLALKYCGQLHPSTLLKILKSCAEFIKVLRDTSPEDHDLSLRLMFCDFLSCCALTTLARAEDRIRECVQYYTEVRKHSKELRRTAAEKLRKEQQTDSARADIITKHFQVVKLEIEAALKLEDWDGLEELFSECFKYENPSHLDTLADLALVVHSRMVKTEVDRKYQDRLLKVMQKIINLSWRQTSNSIDKTSRWLRCLFHIALTFDESISLACLEQATTIASQRQGGGLPQDIITPPATSPLAKAFLAEDVADEVAKASNHYPQDELAWLATTSYNHAVDYYSNGNDDKCKVWAEKAMSLAHWAEDGGALAGELRGKYVTLRFDDEDK